MRDDDGTGDGETVVVMLADLTGPTNKSQRSIFINTCLYRGAGEIKFVTRKTGNRRVPDWVMVMCPGCVQGRALPPRKIWEANHIPSTDRARVVANVSALATELPPAIVVDAGTEPLA